MRIKISEELLIKSKGKHILKVNACEINICNALYMFKQDYCLNIFSIVLKQSTTPKRQRCSSDSDSRLKKDEAVQDIMTLLSEAHNEDIVSKF